MDNNSHRFDPVRRRIRRLIVAILGAVVLSVSLPLTVWRLYLASDIDEQFLRLRSGGFPAWHRNVPDEKNGCLLFLSAADSLNVSVVNPATKALEQNSIPATSGMSKQDPDDLASWVNVHREVLTLLHAGAAQKAGRYPLDFTTSADLEKLLKLKSAACVLTGEALEYAKQHEFDRATESIEVIYRLGESLVNEPVVMPQLFRYSIETLAGAVLNQVINQGEIRASDLRRLIKLLDEIDSSNGLVRALTGERVLGIELIRNALDLDHSTEPPLLRRIGAELDGPVKSAVHASGFLERDLRFFLTAMETNIMLAQFPPPASLQAAYSMREQSRVAAGRIQLWSAVTLQSLNRVPGRDAEHRAQIRLARTALAVELFRQTNQGSLPGCLNDLVPGYLPSVPIDPFDGKQLRFKSSPAGYLVYSVGLNGVDDDGKEKRSRSTGQVLRGVYDVVFKVER